MNARDVLRKVLVDAVEELPPRWRDADDVVDLFLDALVADSLLPLLANYLYDHNIELAHVLRRVYT